MKFFKYVLLIPLFTLCFAAESSLASENFIPKPSENIAPEVAASWVGSRYVVVPIADEMRAEGLQTFLEARHDAMLNMGMPLYVSNVKILEEEHPEYYAKLTKAVTEYKREGYNYFYFSSAEDWAKIGDRVMLAHFSYNSSSSLSGFDDMSKQFTPQMLEKMPAKGRQKIQNMLGMLKTLQNVSEYDRQVAKKLQNEIILFLQEMEK